MDTQLTIGPIHHLTLTVTDLDRSVAFYIDILGFQPVITLEPAIILSNGYLFLALTHTPN